MRASASAHSAAAFLAPLSAAGTTESSRQNSSGSCRILHSLGGGGGDGFLDNLVNRLRASVGAHDPHAHLDRVVGLRLDLGQLSDRLGILEDVLHAHVGLLAHNPLDLAPYGVHVGAEKNVAGVGGRAPCGQSCRGAPGDPWSTPS